MTIIVRQECVKDMSFNEHILGLSIIELLQNKDYIHQTGNYYINNPKRMYYDSLLLPIIQ